MAVSPTNGADSTNSDICWFDEAIPHISGAQQERFKSECLPDKKVKIDNLFAFRRTQGDLHVSIAAAAIALFFLAAFWTHTGWDARNLPDNLGQYILHQFGVVELEGRVTRLGRILKQSWVVPVLCLLVLVPTALWNAYASFKVHQWRKRFRQPVNARYEFSKYLSALEYVVYFLVYTLMVPNLGYLLSTVVFACFLVWRLGYRSTKWMGITLLSSFAAVIVFRTFLQIKTPGSIWLYDQLPTAARAFMLTYF